MNESSKKGSINRDNPAWKVPLVWMPNNGIFYSRI